MNSINLSSTAVKVFPFARYRESRIDLSSRLFYEYNVARLIKQLIDTEGFIISGKIDETTCSVSETVALNIGGYYFELQQGAQLSPSNTSNVVYAYIVLTNISVDENNQPTPPELVGQDDKGNFTALTLCDDIPTGIEGNVIYLKLAEKDINGNWVLATESYKKFSMHSLLLEKIDGKH